jgi:hypothetical protein
MLKDTEISNSKHPARMTAGKQIPNKSQITISNDPNRFGIFQRNVKVSLFDQTGRSDGQRRR